MNKKIKENIQGAAIILITIFGIPIGYYIHHHLKSFGVTYITISDVIGCYTLSTAICFFVGLYVGAIFLERKL